MRKDTPVREWINNFNEGKYQSNDFKTQCEAGWYDWFCRDTSLAAKTKRMGSIIKQVKDGGKVNLDNEYVWFKNNCPCDGPLYDDFRFADIESGEVLLTITVNCCWSDRRYAVYGRRTPEEEGQWETPIFSTDSSRELVAWLNTPWSEC